MCSIGKDKHKPKRFSGDTRKKKIASSKFYFLIDYLGHLCTFHNELFYFSPGYPKNKN